MNHQLFVIWHSSSKYRGVTKVLTKIVKVGISVFVLPVMCNMMDGLVLEISSSIFRCEKMKAGGTGMVVF